jgi:hypothetical protein
MTDITQERLKQLSLVVAGEADAHVWRSNDKRYAGADMLHVIKPINSDCSEDEHGLPVDFANAIGIYYAGKLTPEEAALKIASFHLAAEKMAA